MQKYIFHLLSIGSKRHSTKLFNNGEGAEPIQIQDFHPCSR